MTSDFSCTTPTQRIGSQIVTMASVQELFEFEMRLGCGIPTVDMAGSKEDWKRLCGKFAELRALLRPIADDLELPDAWWEGVANIFKKLLDTYRGKPDKKWWSTIVSSRPYGSMGESTYYSGWFFTDLLGVRYTSYAINKRKLLYGPASKAIVLYVHDGDGTIGHGLTKDIAKGSSIHVMLVLPALTQRLLNIKEKEKVHL